MGQPRQLLPLDEGVPLRELPHSQGPDPPVPRHGFVAEGIQVRGDRCRARAPIRPISSLSSFYHKSSLKIWEKWTFIYLEPLSILVRETRQMRNA